MSKRNKSSTGSGSSNGSTSEKKIAQPVEGIIAPDPSPYVGNNPTISPEAINDLNNQVMQQYLEENTKNQATPTHEDYINPVNQNNLDNYFGVDEDGFRDEYYNNMLGLWYMNQESAIQQMSFQEYMSNTAHQRETQDLLKAGLNPILSANNGASTPMGAYATVDSTPITAKFQKQQLDAQIKANKDIVKSELENQQEIAKLQIEASKYMNKYSVDKSYQLGKYQSDQSLYGAMYGADQSAFASMYSAGLAAAASRYVSDNQLLNSREQRDYDDKHPSNAYQLGGSLINNGSSILGAIAKILNPNIGGKPNDNSAK